MTSIEKAKKLKSAHGPQSFTIVNEVLEEIQVIWKEASNSTASGAVSICDEREDYWLEVKEELIRLHG